MFFDAGTLGKDVCQEILGKMCVHVSRWFPDMRGQVEPWLMLCCCHSGSMMVTGVQICGALIFCLIAAIVMGKRWSLVSGRRTDVGMTVTVRGLQ